MKKSLVFSIVALSSFLYVACGSISADVEKGMFVPQETLKNQDRSAQEVSQAVPQNKPATFVDAKSTTSSNVPVAATDKTPKVVNKATMVVAETPSAVTEHRGRSPRPAPVVEKGDGADAGEMASAVLKDGKPSLFKKFVYGKMLDKANVFLLILLSVCFVHQFVRTEIARRRMLRRRFNPSVLPENTDLFAELEPLEEVLEEEIVVEQEEEELFRAGA